MDFNIGQNMVKPNLNIRKYVYIDKNQNQSIWANCTKEE